MTDAPSTKFLGPRHLVGGRWRVAVERTAVAVAVAPAVVAVVVAGGGWVAAGPVVGTLVLASFVSAITCWPIGRRWARFAYWRCRWWFDARAALLALNAEQGLFGVDTGVVDRSHVVVAPVLRRLQLVLGGRRYTVRPLPSQTASTFEELAGHSGPAPLSPEEATNVTPPWPAGVVKW